jgi:hypothetical protein
MAALPFAAHYRKGESCVNILQGIVSAMQQPTVPLHVGESFFLWRQYVATTEGKTLCQTLMNHTKDPELLAFIKDFLTEVEEPQIKDLAEIMKQEGIEFPSLVTDKANTQGQEIPAGAHFSDQETCHLLVGKIEVLMLYCYFGMSQTLRDDVALAFTRFLTTLVRYGTILKRLADKRGWLLHPPPFAPRAPH